jgi:hypothetical protein
MAFRERSWGRGFKSPLRHFSKLYRGRRLTLGPARNRGRSPTAFRPRRVATPGRRRVCVPMAGRVDPPSVPGFRRGLRPTRPARCRRSRGADSGTERRGRRAGGVDRGSRPRGPAGVQRQDWGRARPGDGPTCMDPNRTCHQKDDQGYRDTRGAMRERHARPFSREDGQPFPGTVPPLESRAPREVRDGWKTPGSPPEPVVERPSFPPPARPAPTVRRASPPACASSARPPVNRTGV